MSKFAHKELFNLICGDLLGEGHARKVYTHNLDPSLVVKVETAGKSFSNIKEWEYWQELQYCRDIAKWLAPCIDISPSGLVLIQKRVEPIPKGRLPKQVPRVFTDLQQINWGLYKNKPVCCDYGLMSLEADSKLKKVNWK